MFTQYVSPVVEFSSAGGLTRSTPSAGGGRTLLPTEARRVPRRTAEHRHLAGADAGVENVGEALAKRAEILADHRRVVLAGNERALLAGQSDVARRERQVRDARGLRFGDGAGEGDADVGIPDDEVDAALDQEPHVVGVNLRILVEVGGGRDDRADLGVRERLEDGLHVTHRTPDVHRAAATVGVTHDQLTTATGVTRLIAPTLQCLVDGRLVEVLIGTGDRREHDVPALRRRRLDRAEGLLDERRIRRRSISPNSASEPPPGSVVTLAPEPNAVAVIARITMTPKVLFRCIAVFPPWPVDGPVLC